MTDELKALAKRFKTELVGYSEIRRAIEAHDCAAHYSEPAETNRADNAEAERDKLAAENAALVAKVAKLESGFVEMNQLAIDREHFHDRMIAEGQKLEAQRDAARTTVRLLEDLCNEANAKVVKLRGALARVVGMAACWAAEDCGDGPPSIAAQNDVDAARTALKETEGAP